MFKAGLSILIAAMIMPVYAFEDCIIASDARMTDVRVKNPEILEVHTLVTVMNEKNTLVVHPLGVGSTHFSVMKDDRLFDFRVDITEDETIVEEKDGFEVMALDSPPEVLDYELDRPPLLRDEEVDEEEIPPALREGEE